MGQIPMLVDPRVSRLKFDREVKDLLSLQVDYRKRGWIIESVDYPIVRITFVAGRVQPSIAATVDINFSNYNVWPPSVRFVHPVTLLPTHLSGARLNSQGQPQSIIIDAHPVTKEVFLCLPGVCEYHNHPQHDGDSWDMHRYTGEGKLFFLIEKIWTYCISNIVCFTVNVSMAQYAIEARP